MDTETLAIAVLEQESERNFDFNLKTSSYSELLHGWDPPLSTSTQICQIQSSATPQAKRPLKSPSHPFARPSISASPPATLQISDRIYTEPALQSPSNFNYPLTHRTTIKRCLEVPNKANWQSLSPISHDFCNGLRVSSSRSSGRSNQRKPPPVPRVYRFLERRTRSRWRVDRVRKEGDLFVSSTTLGKL